MADGLGGEVLPDRLIGERIAGRFVVEKLIGRGELSTAFRAHDERLHRRVTVKLFHPRHRDDVQVVESQLAAARSVARLSHEHVAMVIDQGEHEGMPLIVLEHVRGENLQERIDRFAPLAVMEVVGYGLQIARALAYSHGQAVMHGNLRPGNVLLTEDREVKLVDFGGGSYVAQLVGDPYAAPELREVGPEAPPEPQDDIYALGALLFVALVEQAPIAGLDPGELQLLRPDVSPRLAATVARALAADPDDRHSSMRELAAELASVQEAVATPAAGASRFGGEHTQDFATQELEETAVGQRGREDGDTAPMRARRRSTRGERRRRSPRETRARILAWSMVVAPLALVVLVGVMIAGERGSDQVDGSRRATGGPTAQVAIVSTTSFDPEPDGDGEEREDLAANAIDGDVETAWQTEGYDTRTFNDRKAGVGLVLDLGEERRVSDLAIVTDLPGWIAEVYTADVPATTLAGWTRSSSRTPVESGARIPVDLDGASTRYLLLWVARLSIDTNDTNRARARIAEVRAFAVGGAADASG